MKKLLILAITLIAFGCSKKDSVVEPERRFTPIKVDGQTIEIEEKNSTGNENCNNVYANMTFRQGEENLLLNFTFLKTGELVRVRLDRMENGIGYFTYLTPFFTPDSSIKIKNFKYDPVTKKLAFEFDGTLFYEDKNSKTLSLSGSFSTNSLTNAACNVANNQVNYNSDSFKFNTRSSSFSRIGEGQSTYLFWSTYGTSLEIKLEKKIMDLPIGKIALGQLSGPNQIIFKKYIGPLVASQNPSTIDSDFMTYQVIGTIDIKSKEGEGANKYVKGTIDMDAIYDGKIIFQARDMTFQIQDF